MHLHVSTCTLHKVAFASKSTLLPYEVLALINGRVAFMDRHPTPWYLYMSVQGKDNLGPGRCGGWENVISVIETFGIWVKEFLVPGGVGSLKSLEPSSSLKRDLRTPSGD